MDERIKSTYDLYMEKINVLETEINEKKKLLISYKNMINQLLVDSGEEPKFSETSVQPESSAQLLTKFPDNIFGVPPTDFNIKIGEFYRKPLAKSVRSILERRGGAMLFSDIQEALIKGGADAKDEKRLRLLLLKSRHFDLLPDKQHFILVPKEKQKKIKSVESKQKADETQIPKKRGRPKKVSNLPQDTNLTQVNSDENKNPK